MFEDTFPAILSLSLLQTKCHQYWPEVGSMNMGDIAITLIEVQDLAYYTIRTFRVTRVSWQCPHLLLG